MYFFMCGPFKRNRKFKPKGQGCGSRPAHHKCGAKHPCKAKQKCSTLRGPSVPKDCGKTPEKK